MGKGYILDWSFQPYFDASAISENKDDVVSLNFFQNKNVKTVVQEIYSCKNLKELNLSSIPNPQISSKIRNLKDLEVLYLSNCHITEIPKNVFLCQNLKELHLSVNYIDHIPKEIESLKKLEILDLRTNNLKSLPNEILNLPNLKELYLSNNEFIALNYDFTQLKKLEKLVFKNNKIIEISNFSKFDSALKALDLSFNKINKIDDRVFINLHLESLDLSANNIIELPKTISSINSLNLKFNKINNIPSDIINRGTVNVIKYFEHLSLAEVNVFEAKLIFTGYGDVGKTTLINNLIDGSYRISSNEERTKGVNISHIFWKTLYEGKDIDLEVNIWDFGGQEIYYSTHQYFLSSKCVYVFVWSARNEGYEQAFDYWLNTISLLGDDSPVVVVLNKIDQTFREINQKNIKDQFANVIGFHHTSCLTGDGIRSLQETIISELKKLPHVGEAWPKNWLDVRGEIEKIENDYISLDEFKEFCISHEIENGDEIIIAQKLHDIGVIIFYEDDEFLRNYIILNFEWPTKAAYLVLDSKVVAESNGVFAYSTISKIWSDEGYQSSIQPYILRLMLKYEICFKGENENHYFVPALFSDTPPDFELPKSKSFKFQYRYNFMPAGIISRFIVRNSHLIKDNICWKDGVLISDGIADALVTSNFITKTISIQFYGKDYADLFGLIRADIGKINRKLNTPGTFEEIPCTCRNEYMIDYNLIRKLNSSGKKSFTCYQCSNDIVVRDMLRTPEEISESTAVHYHTENNIMKIKELHNSGNAIIGKEVSNSSINVVNNLSEIIKSHAADEKEEIELKRLMSILTDDSSPTEKKINSKSKIESFLLKHVESIGSGVVTAILAELAKLLL